MPLRAAIAGTALFAPSGPWNAPSVEGLDVLRHAIAGRRKLRFEYVDQEGSASERSARPLGLYFWGAKWSLAAYCELRQDYRSFRPDRMTQIAVLDESWSSDEGTDLAAFLERVDRER